MSRNVLPDQFIRLRDLSRSYPIGSGTFAALDNVTLELPRGAFVAVVGRSGSGKSTLLNLLAGLDHPTRGTLEVDGTSIQDLDEDALATWRGRRVGVVFQSFQLLPTLTIAENVALPMDFCGTRTPARARMRARELLALVGIEDQMDKLPSALSGGQQQRAGIARALANDPPLIVADEPTGNLDVRTAELVVELLARLARENRTVIMVTHDANAGALADIVVTLSDGRIVDVARKAARDA
jgi:putative ABC transport system ATP-binding protein